MKNREKIDKGDRSKKRRGASIRGQSIGLVKYDVNSPDITDFKSIQIDIGVWINPDSETSQLELDHALAFTKKRIKIMVRSRSERNGFIQPETIVDIFTGSVKSTKKKSSQFLRIDVCFFIQPGYEWTKYFIGLLSEDLVQEIVDILKINPDIFNFVENEKWKRIREKKVNA